jgi:hypothetical protein
MSSCHSLPHHVCLTAALLLTLGLKTPAQEPKTQAELESHLAAFLTKLYIGVASEDEAVRRHVLQSAVAVTEDLDLLLGADAKLIWPTMKKRLDKELAAAPRMVGPPAKAGYLETPAEKFELVDLRTDEARRAKLAALFALIPADIPVFRVVTRRDDQGQPAAQSGPYLYVRGRWVWIPNFDQVPGLLKKIKERQAAKAPNAAPPPAGGVSEP